MNTSTRLAPAPSTAFTGVAHALKLIDGITSFIRRSGRTHAFVSLSGKGFCLISPVTRRAAEEEADAPLRYADGTFFDGDPINENGLGIGSR